MGLQYKVRSSSTLERWYELHFEEVNGPEQTEIRGTFLPPEWFPQSGVQLTWPHAGTDWCHMLEEVTACYVRMAYEIASHEPLLIVTPERTKVETLLKEKLPAQVFAQIRWADCPTDDTWARDHGFITLIDETGPLLFGFLFQRMGKEVLRRPGQPYQPRLDEARHIERDVYGPSGLRTRRRFHRKRRPRHAPDHFGMSAFGQPQRPPEPRRHRRTAQIVPACREGVVARPRLFVRRRHGQPYRHFGPFLPRPNHRLREMRGPYGRALRRHLARMEEQLRTFRTLQDEPYRLVALPMPEAIFDEDGQRLPATYANFLVVNGAVLMPTYHQPALDEQARKALQKAFPQHEVVGIDCRPLIRQHGSLHCCTMQFPVPVLK